MIDETELFDQPPEVLPLFASWATVGFHGDPDVVQLGRGEADSITLVKVTLRRGSPRGRPVAADGGFNGHQIAVQLSGPGWDVPPRGTRVVVLFPDGDIETPGNGIIIARAGASPSTRFGRKKSVLDYRGKDLVIAADSVSLVSEVSGRHVLSVSGEGGAQVISDGSGLFVKGGEVSAKAISSGGALRTAFVANQNSIGISRMADPANPTSVALTAGGVELSGGFITVDATTALKLGKAATPATPILLGLSGPAAVPSTCIWGAPAPA